MLPTLPIKGAEDAHVPASQYDFEAIMGIGFGSTLSTILTLAPLVVDSTDLRKFSLVFPICVRTPGWLSAR